MPSPPTASAWLESIQATAPTNPGPDASSDCVHRPLPLLYRYSAGTRGLHESANATAADSVAPAGGSAWHCAPPASPRVSFAGGKATVNRSAVTGTVEPAGVYCGLVAPGNTAPSTCCQPADAPFFGTGVYSVSGSGTGDCDTPGVPLGGDGNPGAPPGAGDCARATAPAVPSSSAAQAPSSASQRPMSFRLPNKSLYAHISRARPDWTRNRR